MELTTVNRHNNGYYGNIDDDVVYSIMMETKIYKLKNPDIRISSNGKEKHTYNISFLNFI